MRRVILASALLLVSPATSSAMPESFGSGHTLRLLKSADVQMVSEDVTIWPTCGATTTMHRVEFHCVFVLKNYRINR